jgi:hypothetical protein
MGGQLKDAYGKRSRSILNREGRLHWGVLEDDTRLSGISIIFRPDLEEFILGLIECRVLQ